jgi:NRPS condensation-like uncharacterized protein
MTTQSNLSPSLPPSSLVEKRGRKLPVRVPLTETSTAQLVRPLGAFERAIHRVMEEYPMHFSVVAELAGTVEPAQLRQALVAVQHRHPLLSVHVEDHPGTRLGFYRSAVVPPIPLTVLDADLSWEQVAAEELATAFDATTAPLMRAVLLRQGPAAATLVLTFDHVIADGKSALYVLQDILAVLHGQPQAVLPVPASRETLLARRSASAASAAAPAVASPAPDWLNAPGTLRPFDGSLPSVTSLAFSAALTSQLAQRCRAEQTTVQAALVVAASQVMTSAGHRQHVRITSPIDIREVLGAGRDCAMYFSSTRTTYTAAENQDFWELARTTGTQLTQGRAESMTRFVSAMMEQVFPVDIDHATARDFSIATSSRELFISNLGRLEFSETGPIRPVAIWGPITLTQMQGESTIAVATLQGQLRLTSASYAPIPDFLALIQDQLATQLAGSARGTRGAATTGYLRGLMAQETIF